MGTRHDTYMARIARIERTAALLLFCSLIASSSALPSAEAVPGLHTYLLLDRSGSMHAIRDDMVGSFNNYIHDLQQDPLTRETRLTLAQFDSQEPFELLHQAQTVSSIGPLSTDKFVPRAATPLYDALASMISHARQRADHLKEANATQEKVVIVVLTDGQENSSVEHSRAGVAKLAESYEKEHGWTFVFLGANIDAYAEGGGVGISAKNSQNFAFDKDGVAKAMKSLTRGTTDLAMLMNEETSTQAAYGGEMDYFSGVKEAEMDYQHRSNGHQET